MADRSRAAPFQKAMNKLFNAVFRLRKGKLAFRGAPALILHTTGRKSGRQRQTPLLYLDVGDGSLAIVGSNGGDDRTPAWVHNLTAHPEVEAELAGSRRAMVAEIADDATRDELWPELVAMYGSYADYQTKTERQIPVILLRPAAGSG